MGLAQAKFSAIFSSNSLAQKLRRFRKPFPLAFLVLALMAFLGGALHAPTNYDALAYRVPRVLHWLAADQWHWIHSFFDRINNRSCGIEWVSAPFLVLLHTDRLLFLINIFSFLLLPGLVFQRVHPAGGATAGGLALDVAGADRLLFRLQAGSIGNDLFGALFCLIAIEFALRARQEQKISDLWISGLAAGLMTAAKAFNILLLLPWALAALPSFRLLLRRPLLSAGVVLITAGASLAPTALLNVKYCGDWTGLKAEAPSIGGDGRFFRFFANAVNLPLANLAPPIFPFRQQWEQLVQRVVPAHVAAGLQENMEAGAAGFQIPEMQMEESAGLGAGVTLLVLVVFVRKIRAGKICCARLFGPEILVPLGAWAGVGVFMVQVGVAGSARYLLPFYPCWSRRCWRGPGQGIFSVAGSGAACRCASLPGPPCC